MEEILKICGTALICVVMATVVKRLGAPTYAALSAAGVTALFSFFVPKLSEIVEYATDIGDGATGYMWIIVKICAVALICEFSSHVAASSGEDGIAKGIAAAGKVEIIYISLPIIKDLYNSALTLAGAGQS